MTRPNRTEREWATEQMRQLSQSEIGTATFLSPRFNLDVLALAATEQLGWFAAEEVTDDEFVSMCVWKTKDLI